MNWQDFPEEQRIYDKDDGLIFCGDAEDILKKFPDKCVSVVVTSPPYNTGINYDGYNDNQDMKAYFAKMRAIFTECYRVLVTGGRVIVNLPSCISQFGGSRVAYLAIDFYLMLRDIGYLGHDFVAWLKMPKGELVGNSTAWGSWCSCSNPALRDAIEWIIIMCKESRKLVGRKEITDITPQEFMQFSTNCWYMPCNHDQQHPASFPKDLPYRAMKLYSYQDNVILDPFCGSGTTCLVAKENHRFFIGIDISERYCQVANAKLGQGLLL